MRILLQIITLLLLSTVIPTVANAWTSGGGVIANESLARCSTWQNVPASENLIDAGRVFCELKEDGNSQGDNTRTCTRLGSQYDINCVAIFIDDVVCPGSEYCAQGWAEISKVLFPFFQDRQWWPSVPSVWDCVNAPN